MCQLEIKTTKMMLHCPETDLGWHFPESLMEEHSWELCVEQFPIAFVVRSQTKTWVSSIGSSGKV